MYVSNSVVPDMDELTHNISEWGGVSVSSSHQMQQTQQSQQSHCSHGSLIALMEEVRWIGPGRQLQKQTWMMFKLTQTLFQRFSVKFQNPIP